jgi:hypothetical protein
MWRESVYEQVDPCRRPQLVSNPSSQQAIVKVYRTIVLVPGRLSQFSGVEAACSGIVMRLQKVELTPSGLWDPPKCRLKRIN